jgi:uncharacterized membrane protein
MHDVVKTATLYISSAVEMLAAIIIGLAVVKTCFQYFRHFLNLNRRPKRIEKLEDLRIRFGSSVAVALELLLGADVLATAVAPGWDAIGKLAAIAVLRTALNYFLERELRQVNEMHKESFKTRRYVGNEAVI